MPSSLPIVSGFNSCTYNLSKFVDSFFKFKAEKCKSYKRDTKDLKTFDELKCFCGMVDRWKAYNLISSRDHCQRSSPSRTSDTERARFEPAQNLSSGFVEWSCAAVLTTTPRRKNIPGQIFLVTMDVPSLCTNINHEKLEGLVYKELEKRKTKSTPSIVIGNLILTGIAMGTIEWGPKSRWIVLGFQF